MGIRNFPVITIGENTGGQSVIVATNGQINLSAIPTQGGGIPKYVYCVCAGGTSTNIIVISPGYTGGSITVAEVDNAWPLHADGSDPIILDMHGYFRISFRAYIGTNSFLHCIPLEDF